MNTIKLIIAVFAVVMLTACVNWYEYPTYGSEYTDGLDTLKITPVGVWYELQLNDVWSADSYLNIGDHITFDIDYHVVSHTIKENQYNSITLNQTTYYLIK